MLLASDFPRLPLTRTVFRIVRAGVDPLATSGSLQAGGRFNPPHVFGAIYASLEAQTAVQEVARGLRVRGIDPQQFPPAAWWCYELEVRLRAVLDLTDSAILRKVGLSADTLTGSDLERTRQIAGEARRAGFEALLVPSAAAPGGRNLVILADRLAQLPTVLGADPVRLVTEPA